MKQFVTGIFILIASVLSAQSDIQYNIIVEGSEGNWSLSYEKKSRSDKRFNHVVTTTESDSFLLWILEDISSLPNDKKELLFYIHGMWGGRKSNFRRAYNMMEEQYINNPGSDIARIVSLKWPGNDFDYKKNKSRVYALAPFIEEEIVPLVRKLQLMGYIALEGKIHTDMIVHSLGNELLKEIILEMPDEQLEHPLWDNVIWAASDLDFDIFEDTKVVERFEDVAFKNVFYFSDRDLTLEVSRKLNDKDRLGRGGPLFADGLPSNFSFVDVSLVKDESNFPDLISGHSYYRSSTLVTQDIIGVLMGDYSNANQSRLSKVNNPNYFVITP